MFYQNFRRGLNSKTNLIPLTTNIQNLIKDDSDYYTSLFYYNEDQKKYSDSKGSIAGINNAETDRLFFDFDKESDPSIAIKDSITLAVRLMTIGIPEDAIYAFWSGNKGTSIEVNLDKPINTDQFKNAVFKLASDLNTFDDKIKDANRIIRVPNTKHPVSGLYKIPLELWELEELSLEQIKTLAKEKRFLNKKQIKVSIPKEYTHMEQKKVNVISNDSKIDFLAKPKGWSNCKWALANGYEVKENNRNEKLLAVIATCKALNSTVQQAFYMAKNAYEMGLQRYGGEKKDGWKEELWSKAEYVYSSNWQGGSFSCKDGKTPWLTTLCNSLDKSKCKHGDERSFIELEDISNVFSKFATEIEKNKIKTGLKTLDENVTLCTSTLVGLLASPGTGKSTVALNILNHTNKHDVNSIFFSMDMGIPLVYLKMIQKHFGITSDDAFKIFKNDPKRASEIMKKIKEEYPNVKFSFKSGQTVDGIKESVLSHEEETGKKVKLVVVDYLECIRGEFSDATANSALIANQLKDIANETETCILLLLQTQKHAGQPDEPLLSMRNIKGSSVIEQACSVILTMWREGYSPKYSHEDNFISIATVKDRLNSLWSEDFHWTGLTGNIREMMPEEHAQLEELRKKKREDKAGQSKEEW